MVISGVTRRARWQLIVRCMSFEALSTPDEKKMIVREYSDVCLLLEEVSLSPMLSSNVEIIFSFSNFSTLALE